MANRAVYTIGHSTLAYDRFFDLLKKNHIDLLVDIRSLPGSSFVPQYNQKALSKALSKDGIGYTWIKELGGRRYGLGKKSPNVCWKNKSFRGYADYMMTSDFRKGIKILLNQIKNKKGALMCAEALYWRCHRNLIADYLKSKQMRVVHIGSNGILTVHRYTKCANIRKGKLTYW